MLIVLLVLGMWTAVSGVLAITWAMGARSGYDRALQDVRRRAAVAEGRDETLRIDEVGHLVG